VARVEAAEDEEEEEDEDGDEDEDEESQEDDEPSETETCREVEEEAAAVDDGSDTSDDDDMMAEQSETWQKLELRCAISHQRLTDPATLGECTHLSRCSHDALVGHRRHQSTCSSQKSTCPVFGCQAVCARRDSVVRDDRLRSLLAAASTSVEFVWLRGDRLSITPPAGVAGGSSAASAWKRPREAAVVDVSAGEGRPAKRRQRTV